MAVITGDEFVTPISIDDKASPAFKRMSANAEKATGGFSGLQAAIVTFNQALALMGRGFNALTNVMEITIGNFAEFETALVGVGKTTNIQGNELESLGDAFQRLSETLPKSAAELAGIGQTAGQLGVTGAANILKFTEVMAKLESASNLSGEAGATAIARILNITDGGVQNVERFGAAIVGLGNSFAATEAEITDVATDVARGLSVFGVSSANILGLSTALKSMGAQAQLSGSVLGRSFREIESAVRNGGSELTALKNITGETGENLRKQFGQDSVGVFVKFINGLSRIQKSGQSVSEALATMGMTGDEVNKILPVMASRSELVGRALATANREFNNNTALNEEAARANKTLAAEWTKLRNTFVNAASDMGAVVAPNIKLLIAVLKTDFVNAVELSSKTWSAFTVSLTSVDFAKLSKSVESFAFSLSVVATAFAAPALIAGLTAIIPALGLFAGMAAKFALMAFSILTIASALNFVIINMRTLIDLIGTTFMGLVYDLSGALKQVFFGLLDSMRMVLETVSGSVLDVGGKATKALEVVNSGLTNLTASINEGDEAWQSLDNNFNKLIGDIDLGFGGEAFDEGRKFLRSFNKEMDKTVSKSEQIKNNLGSAPATPGEPREIAGGKGGKGAQIFDESQLEMITSAFGEGVGSMASSASSFAGPAMAYAKAAEMILEAIQAIIDIIPKLLNMVANIFNSLVDLPKKITDAGKNVLDGILNFINNFVKNLANTLSTTLTDSANFLDAFGDAIAGLFESLPDIILDLLDKLPQLAENLMRALAKTNPITLVMRIMAGIIKSLPKIMDIAIRSIFTAVPEMIGAMIDGFIEGIKQAINDISNALGFGDVFDMPKLDKEIQNMGESILRNASSLFQVMDLEAAARGFDMADRIRNAIESAGRKTGNILEHWWNVLVSVWRQIYDTFLKPFVDLAQKTWEFIWEKILKPFGDLLSQIWGFVWSQIIEPFLTGLKSVWDFVVNEVVGPLVDGLVAVWDFVLKNVVNPLIDGLNAIWKFVADYVITPLQKGFAWVGEIFSSIGKLFTTPTWLSSLSISTPSWLSNLKIDTPGWLQSFADAVNKLTSFGGFSTGGLVKGISKTASGVVSVSNGNVTVGGSSGVSVGSGGVSVGGHKIFNQGGLAFADGGKVPMGSWKNGRLYAAMGSVAQGTDTVPAVLTPGEFVVNRESTRNNLGLLSMMNAAKGPISPAVGNQTSISVVINARTDLSPQQIQREIIPELERQLKKKSMEGSFILANSGIRTNK